MNAPTDLDLLETFRRHQDQQAFSSLVDRHAGWVYGLCLRVTGRAAEAEEASSDAFFELARCAHQVRERLPAWLHTVARRQAGRAIGRRARTAPLAIDLVVQDGQRADLEHLDVALAELPPELRAVLVLRFLSGNSQEEVAGRLGLSQATVSRRIAEALKRMRATLDRRGESMGAVPATLLLQLSPTTLPVHAQETLRRVALVARPALDASGLSIGAVVVAALVLVLSAAGVGWHFASARHLPATDYPVSTAILPVTLAADPPPAVPKRHLPLLGWSERILAIDASESGLRQVLGSARTISEIDGQPVALRILANAMTPAANQVMLTVLRSDGWWRIGPVRESAVVADLEWDPRGGISPGSWDADVAHAAACWRSQPEQALVALERARASGCSRAELSVFAAAVAAEADRPQAAKDWHDLVPPTRGDRWMADMALHRVLRAHGQLRQARTPLEHLSPGLGRLPADLGDVTIMPTFPDGWHALTGLGTELSWGYAHVWDGRHTEQVSPAIGPTLAVDAHGDVFTAMPGLARSQDVSGIYLRPVYADGHPAGPREFVGVLGMGGSFSRVCDGSGALVPWLPAAAGAINLRILCDSHVCAVWVDGRLRALAPQRHQGPWQMVVSANSCDIYLPRFVVSAPQAASSDNLLGAIIADDAEAVRKRLRAGDDPVHSLPGADETPLNLAATGDRVQAIGALLEDKRVQLDAVDRGQGTALYRAVDNHALGAARLLLERGAHVSPLNRYGTTPLGYACRSRNLELLELLLAHGANTDIEHPSPDRPNPALDLLAPGPGTTEVIAAFQRHGIALSPRALACAGRPDAALSALTGDVRDREGPALLTAAVLLDDKNLMDGCLRAGVAAESRDPETGMTALALAVGITGNFEIASDLVAHGAQVDTRCKYGTVLDLAREDGFPIQRLRSAQAQIHSGF